MFFSEAFIGCSKKDIPASFAFLANSAASSWEKPSLASAEKKHLSCPIFEIEEHLFKSVFASFDPTLILNFVNPSSNAFLKSSNSSEIVFPATILIIGIECLFD